MHSIGSVVTSSIPPPAEAGGWPSSTRLVSNNGVNDKLLGHAKMIAYKVIVRFKIEYTGKLFTGRLMMIILKNLTRFKTVLSQ